MTFVELLIQRQEPLVRRWQEAILAEYGDATAARWRRLRDPFANPVGHALSQGLPLLFLETTRDGELSASATSALEDILRIRSVQQLTPSRAVGFFAHLPEALRIELAAELATGAYAAEALALQRRIERLQMAAFDIYVQFRDQVSRLRQNELKRSVASLVRRWHGSDADESTPDSDVSALSCAAPR